MEKLDSLHKIRQQIDKKYIGFVPQNISIKPVHIANGLFKKFYGFAYNTRDISRISYVQNAKGIIPRGQSDQEVKDYLELNRKISADNIELDQFKTFRMFLQDIINVDKGVFTEKNSMIAYTLSSKIFLNTDNIYQDAGVFIASVISDASSDLQKLVHDALSDTNDPISILFLPVNNDEVKGNYQASEYEDVASYKMGTWETFQNQLKETSDTLTSNLKLIPNKLTRLRLVNFFSIFQIIRYLFSLESLYKLNDSIQPLLFDCSNDNNSSIAKASQICMINSIQSVSRVYIYFFKSYLKDKYTIEQLHESEVPLYEDGKKSKHPNEYAELWNMAKKDAIEAQSEDLKYTIFAQSLYDMLILDASAEIKLYLLKLGSVSGIFYPPTNTVRGQYKRVVFSNEQVEILVKSCVKAGELITMNELLKRLYDRFNLIIGGREVDELILKQHGVTQLDEEALKENQSYFEKKLKMMNFAEIMADGILQIRIGGDLNV